MGDERGKYIQGVVMNNIYGILKAKGINEEDYFKFLKENTVLKEARIKKLMAGTNARIITIDEIGIICKALKVLPSELLKNIERRV